ncbi:ligand-binding sensor domain-containing protein [Aquimarina sp. M1]
MIIKIKLLIVIILSLVIYSCSRQRSKDTLQNITPEKDLEHIQSNKNSFKNSSLFLDFDNQIDQVVRTIFQDSKRNFWFGTESGLLKFDGKSLIQINSIKSTSGKGVTIKDIAESKDGKIWFAHTGGVSSIDGELVTNYYESDGLISHDVWCITSDTKENIWFGTIDGVCVFDGSHFTSFEIPEGKIDTTRGVSSTKIVHDIMEDNNGNMWFSTNAGLFSYANNKLINISAKAGIQTNFINEVFEDKQGDLWVSTKKGLYNLRGNKTSNITEGRIKDGKGIGSIAEDKDGNIWFVSDQHFLYTFNREKLIEYQTSKENKGPTIFKIYKDQVNRLWFVGFGGAYRLENGKFLNITKNGPW